MPSPPRRFSQGEGRQMPSPPSASPRERGETDALTPCPSHETIGGYFDPTLFWPCPLLPLPLPAPRSLPDLLWPDRQRGSLDQRIALSTSAI